MSQRTGCPQRLAQLRARTGEDGRLRVRLQDDGPTVVLWLYGDIGDPLETQDLVSQIAAMRDREILLRINSTGGVVFDGLALYGALRDHGRVVTRIDGIAASAAAIVALAGSPVQAYRHSQVLLHRAWAEVVGNATVLRDMADWLERTDRSIAEIIAAKTGMPVSEAHNLLIGDGDGTLLIGEEAYRMKLVDVLLSDDTKNGVQSRAHRVLGFVPSDPPGGEGEGLEGEWQAPGLGDFTDAGWDELSEEERRFIAAHYAWAGSLDAFADLKLPHHWPPSDDRHPRASLNAVRNALARLSQTEGIPEDDVARVEAHLRSHLPQESTDEGQEVSDTADHRRTIMQNRVRMQPTTTVRPLTHSRPRVSLLRAWLCYQRRLPVDRADMEALEQAGLLGSPHFPILRGQGGGFSPIWRSTLDDTIPVRIADVVEEQLSLYDAVRRVAEVIETDTLANLNIPIVDDRAQTARLLGTTPVDMTQNVAPQFAIKTLRAHTVVTGPVVINTALLLDSAIDLERLIGRLLAERLGRFCGQLHTTGAGTTEPEGILTAAPVAVEAPAIGFDQLVDMIHWIDPAYRSRAVWMMHPNVLAEIRKLTDLQGRPLVLEGLTQTPELRLLGYPVVENAAMPAAIQAGVKAVLFGDPTLYLIRERAEIRLRVLEERYVEYDSIAMIAFLDMDACLRATETTRGIGAIKISGGQ